MDWRPGLQWRQWRGQGGVGVSATADTVVTGSGLVKGGTGGVGGSNSNDGGGGGGVGVFSSANVTVDAGGSVTGDTGGRGGSQGGGGGGAAAIVLTGGGTVQNSGNLLGGTGGNSILAGGGDGGAGVLLLSGGTVINTTGATITGGIGGQAGTTGVAGDGGAGIKGANIAIINAGTISGGAVDASGGAPVAGQPSSSPVGSIRWRFRLAQPSPATWWLSAPPILSLGGDTNASFDVSQIGAGAKYDGFGFFEKTGNSTWTLTGTTTPSRPGHCPAVFCRSQAIAIWVQLLGELDPVKPIKIDDDFALVVVALDLSYEKMDSAGATVSSRTPPASDFRQCVNRRAKLTL